MDISTIFAPERPAGIPELQVGDTVRVYVRVIEGGRERLQAFEGVVIALHKPNQPDGSFTVRRIASHGIGVERIFPIRSPRIDRVEVIRHARVRRAKLYYLRGLTGKAAKLKERRPSRSAGAS